MWLKYMIIENNNILGESPLWNHMNETYYWVDIMDKKIKSMNDNNIFEYKLPISPTCLFLHDTHIMTVGVEDGIGLYDFRIQKFNYIHQLKMLSNARLNDGKCDKNGTIYIGSMDKNESEYVGSIYRFKDGHFDATINNIGISNGISFNSDNKMYACDSLSGEVFTYSNGIKNIIHKYVGISPDGSTIDQNDNYYSCLWGGSRIDVFNKNNKLFDSINLPFKYPTCCCFGGPYLDKLLVTSASTQRSNDTDGKLALIDCNTQGVKESIAKIQ
jgi:sugar lactone lactonase YvrE